MEKAFATVADRLKQIRLQKNYTQDYMASKIGVTQKAYSKIENNESRLNVETLLVLSEALETPITDFFQNKDKPVLNDFSSSRKGDNVIYKNEIDKNSSDLLEQLLAAKDEIIRSKEEEIKTLKLVLEKLL
jgi:transcriptional regulator with XRE-family HTH domain